VNRALPLVDPVVAERACCAACAVEPAPAPPALPILRPPAGSAAIWRGADRRITFASVLTAAAVLCAGRSWCCRLGAGGTIWLPCAPGPGRPPAPRSPLSPFFTTALAQVAPARPGLRIAAIGLIAGGSILAGVGMNGVGASVAAAGGLAYLAGLVALASVAFGPLRATIGVRLRLVHLAYAVALAQVATGVTLATAMLAGWSPVARLGLRSSRRTPG
jgi:hypothetical protein